MMFHVLFQSQIAVATGFMEETWSRNLMNVLTTPVTEFEYIAGTAILGIATAVFTLVALTASTVVPLRAAWSRIIVRVAGSWIAAIGLLLFGWSFRPPS